MLKNDFRLHGDAEEPIFYYQITFDGTRLQLYQILNSEFHPGTRFSNGDGISSGIHCLDADIPIGIYSYFNAHIASIDSFVYRQI
jgi:hypothetical protein